MAQLESPPDRVATSKLVDCLADARRRTVLNVLHEANAPLALADLATEVVRAEQAPAPPDNEMVKRCRRMLYHVHLPKLADVGVVEVDTDRRVVALVD